MGNHNRMRVAAYCMLFGDDSTAARYRNSQEEHLKEIINCNLDWEFVGFFSDNVRGKCINDRSGLQSMFQRCRDGQIDLIMVKSICSLGKSTAEELEIVRALKGMGTDVIIEDLPKDTHPKDIETILTALQEILEQESKQITRHTPPYRFRKD